MNKLVKIVALTSLSIGTQAYALNDGFNFDECSGSGSFEQQINHYEGDYENAIEVGQIPAGIQGLRITLESDRDVDIRLTAGEDKIVHWPYGLLNKSTEEHTDFEGTTVTYSGYNGVDGQKGYEFIEVDGTISRTMSMQAFGYKAGYATVNYSWTGTEGCESGTGTGDGTFTQEIRKKQIVMVGRIPAGIKDLEVALASDNDLDIQLYGADGTAIVAWPGGLLAGEAMQVLEHNGVTIEWSGYNGDGTNKGHEYIKITGRTNEVLTMKAYGYESGLAEVSYSWDANNTREDNSTQEDSAMQTLMNTLAYMGNEERLAYDVYNKLFDIWGTRQFTNIANNSEIKHIQSVQQLVQTYKVEDINFTNIDMQSLGYKDTAVVDMEAGVYDIAKIQKLYDDLVEVGSVSEIEALKVACTVEVVDVTDLDEYILLAQEANASDIVNTFTSLRSGSYNHYWTFDTSLKNKGMNSGCCTWTELCHPEYPQNGTTNDNNDTVVDDSNTTGNMNNDNNASHNEENNQTNNDDLNNDNNQTDHENNNPDMPVTKAYFGDKENNLIVVVDVDNMSVLEKITTGHEVTYAAEAIKTKVSGSKGIEKFYIDNRGSDVIDVLDASTNTIVKSINLPFHPRSIDVNKETGLVVVSGADKTMAAVIDSKTDTLLVSVGEDTPSASTGHPKWLNNDHFVLLDRENNQIITYQLKKEANQWSTTLINTLETNSPVHNIIPPEVHGQKGKKHGASVSTIFYATEEGSSSVNGAVLKLEFLNDTGLAQLESLEITPVLEMDIPASETGVHHHNFLADQKTIYVGSKEGTLTVINYALPKMKVIKTINAGQGAGHTAEFKEKNIAVVINHTDKFITVMNTKTHTKIADIMVSEIEDDEVGVVQTQSHPEYYFSKDGRYFYLFLTEEGALVKVDLQTKKVVERLEIGGHLSMGSFVSK